MTRYWAMRTDPARRAFIWAELLDGRLRQGWGYREDQDLELLARIRRAGGALDAGQQATWRGNRLLLPTEPGAVSTGDLIVLANMPRHGAWSIARVTGGYRYQISSQRNATDHAQLDYGHIREVSLLRACWVSTPRPKRRLHPCAQRCAPGSGCGAWTRTARRSRCWRGSS